VKQLLPGKEWEDKRFSGFFNWMDRLNHAYWHQYGLWEDRFFLKDILFFKRCFYAFFRILGLPIAIPIIILKKIGYDPIQLRTIPLETKQGDTLVLLDSSWQIQNFSLVESLKNQGLKILVVIYDILPVLRKEFFHSRLVSMFQTWFNWVIQITEGAICISKTVQLELEEELKGRLTKDQFQNMQFGYFHLGCELDLKKQNQLGNDRVKQVFSKENNVYLAVGTIEPRKNHIYLLDSFDDLWNLGYNINLCIVGKSGWKNEDFFERLKNHDRLNSNIFVFEDLDDNELEYIYSNSHCLLIPSYAEGFGLPVVEAMQKGLPVMASDIPVFHEIGGNSIQYFDIHDKLSLVKLIIKLQSSSIEQMFPNLKNWRWITWKESTTQLLEEIIHQSKEISRI
jgi:alpha-1,2-rhamnosyltransferase